MQLRPNCKLVRNLICQKYGKQLTLKDIHNINTKTKEQVCGNRRDAQIVLDKLTEALKADAKAAGGVVVDENDTLTMLFYQSGNMRDMFSKFPEIMFIDGTYNVNKLGMPLYCLMVEDGFGHGQNIFYAATAKEDAVHLQKIVELFKSENADWESVRVIIIDKDFSEYKILRQEFPNAVILYCQWHVIKALFKCLSDYDVDKTNQEKCREIIRKLVYASSQDDYEKYKKQLFNSTNDVMHKAFVKNWETCKSMWVTYERDQAVHFCNTTNNRLESHNQKLKDVTSRTSSLSEMFQNVLLFIQTTESETSHVAFTEEFTSRCTPDTAISGIAEVQSICTQYAADLIAEQMKLALTIEYTVQILPDSKNVVVTYKNRSHSVLPEAGTCSCTFQQTLLMPCRYIFKYRDHCGSPMFEPSLVAKRWLKSYQVHVGASSIPAVSSNDTYHASNDVCYTSISSTRLSGTLSQSQKYRKIHSLTDKLAFYASQCGMPEFREKHAMLEKILNLWENNCVFTVVPITECTSIVKEKEGLVFEYVTDAASINNSEVDPNDHFDSALDNYIAVVDNPNITVADTVDNPIVTVADTVSDIVDNLNVTDTVDNSIVTVADTVDNLIITDTVDNPIITNTVDNPIVTVADTVDNLIITDTVDNPIITDTVDNPIITDTVDNPIVTVADTVDNLIITDTVDNPIITDIVDNPIVTIADTVVDAVDNTVTVVTKLGGKNKMVCK